MNIFKIGDPVFDPFFGAGIIDGISKSESKCSQLNPKGYIYYVIGFGDHWSMKWRLWISQEHLEFV